VVPFRCSTLAHCPVPAPECCSAARIGERRKPHPACSSRFVADRAVSQPSTSGEGGSRVVMERESMRLGRLKVNDFCSLLDLPSRSAEEARGWRSIPDAACKR
jgi:hypothetical protein